MNALICLVPRVRRLSLAGNTKRLKRHINTKSGKLTKRDDSVQEIHLHQQILSQFILNVLMLNDLFYELKVTDPITASMTPVLYIFNCLKSIY